MAGSSEPFGHPGPAGRQGPPVRASQAERDEAVAELRERFVAGQISQDTFVQRVESALAARDQGQLAQLFDDLHAPRRPRLPGWRELAARLAIGSRAGAVVAPVRNAVLSSARRVGAARGPSWLQVPALSPHTGDLLFPVGSQARFTIGRDPGCDLVIADLTVSRQHAGLDRGTGGWLLTDLGSTNGTRLNGWRVREPVPVCPGDRVSFGAVTFVLKPSH